VQQAEASGQAHHFRAALQNLLLKGQLYLPALHPMRQAEASKVRHQKRPPALSCMSPAEQDRHLRGMRQEKVHPGAEMLLWLLPAAAPRARQKTPLTRKWGHRTAQAMTSFTQGGTSA